jgi:hypothetical protein
VSYFCKKKFNELRSIGYGYAFFEVNIVLFIYPLAHLVRLRSNIAFVGEKSIIWSFQGKNCNHPGSNHIPSTSYKHCDF